MFIRPVGATGEVTGSSFLLETGHRRYLIDCGLFQGHHDDDGRNLKFDFEPDDIDAVFLTHAHLDHCGRLPYLHVLGFRGPVYSTSSTCDLANFILLDSAKVQGEDFRRRHRRGQRSGQFVEQPLYDEQDVLHLMRYFQVQPYNKVLDLGYGLEVVYHQSGHILGSASIEFRRGGKSVLFSGDVGTPGRNVVPDPTPPPPVDLVFCESTYGDRTHRSEAESIAELKESINWAIGKGGNVIIPAFAMERTQDILFHLRNLRKNREIPLTPVYLDSPLAINITKVYHQHSQDLDEATRAVFAEHKDPFRFEGLITTQSTEESRAINGVNGAIIIAGAGMCQAGRVVHHLKYNLWRENCAVVFIGFQAQGTLGRKIVDGMKTVNIDREPVMVKARINTINGFSAHADQPALMNWLATTNPGRIVLNHGEPAASQVLADKLSELKRTVEVAKPGKTYQVGEE
jgi:metallo-beta-lactamase family protein